MNVAFVFNPFALISLFTAILVVGLIIYIARQKYQTATLRWLLAVMVAILTWSSAEFFIRISGDVATAQMFKYWEMAGYILLGPTAVGLSLAYAQKAQGLLQIRWLVFLFAPALAFIYAAWTQNAFVPFAQPEVWHRVWYGEWVAPLLPVFTFGFIPWLNALLLFSVIQLIAYYRTLTNPAKKRQAKILLIGVILPAIVGLITDQLYGTITGNVGIELATLIITISGLCITYGIIKYQLFEVNPAAIATNILNAMPEAVVVCNAKWEIEYASPPIRNLLGYDPNALLGQPMQGIIKHGWEDLGKIAQQNTPNLDSIEVSISDSSNNLIPIGITPTIYQGSHNNTLAYILILVDLRQMRELLNVTEERNKLQATLSSITDGIIGISSQLTISLINKALGSIFHLDADELQDKPFNSVFTLHDNTGLVDLESILYNMGAGGQHQITDIVARAANGQKVDINLIISKLPHESQVDLMAIMTIQNISKERQLENMKSNFTYLAAHELRTPLTSIRGYLHLLKSEIANYIPASNLQILDRAVDSTEQLSALTSRLLEVSEIEQSRLKLNKKVVAWDEFVATFIKKYQEQSRNEGWQLTVQNLASTIEVELDQSRIEQVFTIIITNALKYAEGVPNITFTTEVRGGQVVTRIIDQGVGVTPELLEQLFTPYSRADTGFKQTQQGIGLSLFIAKSIVTMHGGDIKAESMEHHGATFTVSLPIANPDTSLPNLD